VTELRAALEATSAALERVEHAEEELQSARDEFARCLTVAHEAGASYGALADLTGLSRSRIAQLVTGED
jgi:hypothetical protein